MRVPSMIATVVVLVAAFIGVTTLTAFGFTWSEILWLLLPVAVTVAFASWFIFRMGWRSAEWLNRDAHAENNEEKHDKRSS